MPSELLLKFPLFRGSINRGSTVILSMHFLNSEIEFLDHENMGIDTLVELLVYIVMQILTKIGFSEMAALIKGFRVQSHTQDTAATRFYDEGGRPHQKIRFTMVALFT